MPNATDWKSLVKVGTATTGTGTMTLGAAIAPWFGTPELVDGQTYGYEIVDGNNVATGKGTYTASGTTLTRDPAERCNVNGVAQSTPMSLSGTAIVSITELASDFQPIFIYLGSSYTLTSQTAAQKLFNSSSNGAVTVPVGLYSFECNFSLSSMSSTSGSFGFALAGGATFSQQWIADAIKATTQATAGTTQRTWNTAANTALVTAGTATGGSARITGIIKVTASGTIIPQVSLGIAAAAVVATGSYFLIRPLGASTATTGGDWS